MWEDLARAYFSLQRADKKTLKSQTKKSPKVFSADPVYTLSLSHRTQFSVWTSAFPGYQDTPVNTFWEMKAHRATTSRA